MIPEHQKQLKNFMVLLVGVALFINSHFYFQDAPRQTYAPPQSQVATAPPASIPQPVSQSAPESQPAYTPSAPAISRPVVKQEPSALPHFSIPDTDNKNDSTVLNEAAPTTTPVSKANGPTATITPLVPEKLITDCWNQNHQENSDAISRTVAAPFEAGINLVAKPFDLISWVSGSKKDHVKDINSSLRFNMTQFDNNWRGNTMSYDGIIESITVKNKIVVFKQTGAHPHEVRLEVSLTQESISRLRALKKGETLRVIGKISKLITPEMMTIGGNRIIFENGCIGELPIQP